MRANDVPRSEVSPSHSPSSHSLHSVPFDGNCRDSGQSVFVQSFHKYPVPGLEREGGNGRASVFCPRNAKC
ncbi:hypothetical protein Baya_12515 [Bagarius yarrelli]|uniref:Uncharacterized protein n=1 Tax=Bagarius yarrelli TaxID=175774 RepID=A0A556V3G4_BAGYA|nr:hypothetical protein Baya_12515 [Bagarius yarrelli]